MIKGRVINKIQGFYYIDTGNEVKECRLRGVLKKTDKKENCVVGDIVEINEENFIMGIEERKNILSRPVVANIDNLVIQFAARNPVIDYERLALLIIHSFFNKIKPIVVINKVDLISDEEKTEIFNRLSYLGQIEVPLLFISTEKNIGLEELKSFLSGKLTAFAGPSGVGKSSIINMLQDSRKLQTGETSERLKRGKHTTRDSRLLPLNIGGFVIDTPGFSSLELPDIPDLETLESLFPEFKGHNPCKFRDCAHINEPECGIKELLEQGKISQERYDYFKKIYIELKNERWNKYGK